jgi:hypothetical protein
MEGYHEEDVGEDWHCRGEEARARVEERSKDGTDGKHTTKIVRTSTKYKNQKEKKYLINKGPRKSELKNLDDQIRPWQGEEQRVFEIEPRFYTHDEMPRGDNLAPPRALLCGIARCSHLPLPERVLPHAIRDPDA